MTDVTPTFSLIVNTTDRANSLQTLLRALEHQSYPRFEVIIVVGPTRDNTLEILAPYEGRVRVLRCPRANLSQSRNIGLLAARGDLVAFIDDDAVPCQRWLEQLARLFQDCGLDATGGVVYLVHPQGPMVQFRIGLMSSLSCHEDTRASWLEALAPTQEGRQWVARMMGTNMAFRRQALLDAGGFDEFYFYIAEETDLVLRMTNAGYRIHPVQEAAVYHIPASSRNRQVFTYNIKWWLQTRSGTYFSIKNGSSAGDSRRDIALRCLHLYHGHWIWYGQQWREGNLNFSQLWSARFHETWAALAGTLQGLVRARQLIDPARIKQAAGSDETILMFQNSNSHRQAFVDPISGRRPAIELPDPPLRICLLSQQYPPDHYDGISRLTHLMARGLFERGHTVHVITRGEQEDVTFYDGAFVHRIPHQTDRYAHYGAIHNLFHTLNHSHQVYDKVRQIKLNDGIQLVDSPIWQFEGLVTAMSDLVPVVVRLVTTSHQVAVLQNEQGQDARLMGDLERALVERAAHVLPNTQATLNAVQKVYGVQLAQDRYTLVPYGIVPAPENEMRPFAPARASDALTVLYVGRLEKRKGIQDLFQAIPLVLNKLPNVHFIIAGQDNSQYDGFRRQKGLDYPTYFAQQFARYMSRVEFKGLVDDRTLQSLYQSCDLFVAPSLFESFGLIYLEAMNYAKPIVGCRAGGVPEVVEHGVTGLLVEPGTPASLAEAILSLLKSPARLREMGLAGRQRLLDKFTYLQMARNFEQVYRMTIRKVTGSA